MAETFTNWRDCCKYLYNQIIKNKVLAGSNTQIEDTGIRVHAQPGGGSGSSEYNGYFKVIVETDESENIFLGPDSFSNIY